MATRCMNGGDGYKIKDLAAICCGCLLTERAADEMIHDIAPGVTWRALKCCSAAKKRMRDNTRGKGNWPQEQDAAGPAV